MCQLPDLMLPSFVLLVSPPKANQGTQKFLGTPESSSRPLVGASLLHDGHKASLSDGRSRPLVRFRRSSGSCPLRWRRRCSKVQEVNGG